MGPDTSMKAWGHNTTKLGKQPIQGIDPDEVGLPTLDDAGPVVKKDQASGVFEVHGQPPGGGRVSTVIETPLFFAVPSGEGLLKGKVGLNPGDPCKLVTVREDNSPEVTMLPLGHRLGMQKYLKAVRHIPAVRKYMNSAWGSD